MRISCSLELRLRSLLLADLQYPRSRSAFHRGLIDMSARLGPAIVVVALIVLSVPAGATAAGGDISYTCSPSPSNCSGWYKSAVTIHFTITANPGNSISNPAGCSDFRQKSDTPGVSQTCTVTFVDSGGSFTGSATASLKKDATAPAISGINARGPDANGWYNHPVEISVNASDETSGIASCNSLTYSGPDTTSASFTGTCTDNAGNVANGGTFTFKYDSTPPTITNVGTDWADGTATLSWTASADTKEVVIDRAPGKDGAARSTVFNGLASGFEDTGLQNKVKYVYTITGLDEARNKAVKTVSIIPGAKLYAPARGATVSAPPLLAWRRYPGASYYNVQLYVGVGKALRRIASVSVSGRKVLSAWPRQPRYRLEKTWKFKGQQRKLVPGRYRWYVYPGFGKRTDNKYGPLIGSSDFFVTKR
jgi:hypothetical protein